MPARSKPTWKKHLAKLKVDLASESKETREGKDFIPQATFHKHVTKEIVEQCLTDSTKGLLRSIYPRARIIFATLALSSKSSQFHTSLQELIELNITDADLPIEVKKENGVYYAWTIVAGDPNKIAKPFGSVFHGWSWDKVKNFSDQQWMFLAPVFSPGSNKFVHYLHCRQPLPFTEVGNEYSSGHFGDVRKAFLDPEHQEGFEWWSEMGMDSRLWIAVKEYKNGEGVDVAKRAWEGEAKVCEQMPTDEYLVPRIAAVAQADRYYLLLPWADGGDLLSFWREQPTPTFNGSNTMEMLKQFRGLATATRNMHSASGMSMALKSVTTTGALSTPTINEPGVSINGEPSQAAGSHWRHGDMKPENILRFKIKGRWLGNLKMADFGLAKSHSQNTDHRGFPTEATHGTLQYEAPEVSTSGLAPRSRLYDIWSLGCVLLETVIWFLYGFEQLELFWDTPIMKGKGTLYYTTTGSTAEVSEVASSWMRHILEHDPECNAPGGSALRDLLLLVQEKLLVVAIANGHENTAVPQRRTDATGLRDALRAIVSKAEADPGYLCTGRSRANTTITTITTGLAHLRQSAGSSSAGLLAPPSLDTANKRLKLDVSRKDAIGMQGVSLQAARHQQSVCEPPPRSDSRDAMTNGEVSFTSRVSTKYLNQNGWSIHTDDQFAREVHDVLKVNGVDEPPAPSTRLCERCKDFDFPGFGRIEDTLDALEIRSSRCELCELMLKAMTSSSCVDSKQLPFVLRLVDSGLVLGEGKACHRILEACKWPLMETCDATPYLRLGLPRRLRSDDPAHWVILGQWLKECDLHHPQCLPVPGHSSLALVQRPTRVIDVRAETEHHLQLVETGNLLLQSTHESRYVALSYAWGDESHKRFLATPANYEKLKSGMVNTDLPKTFQDAIKVTRELGIRYLWIDGLCILQGPGGDFETEAERMEVVFSNAYCVLAASRATGSSDGFLGERHDYRMVPISRLGGAHVYLYEPIDDFQHDVLDGHLNKRGWVLQERALARRTIFFTGTQTYWQCGSGVRCETMTRIENKEAAFLGDPNFPKVAEDGSKGAQIHLYELLYRTYSTLAFMKAVDRPVGIAGLESRLIRAFGTSGGFGVFEKYLHRGIMWQRASSEIQKISFPQAVGEVPSWSWMAYQGPIEYVAIPFKSVEWEYNDVRSPWTPQPESTGARHSTRTRSSAHLTVVPRMFKPSGSTSSEECLVFDHGSVEPGPGIRCVIIGRQRHHPDSSAARRHYILLIRQRPRSELYERVGVGWLPGSSITFDGSGQLVQVS
ncbi:hypothetical protein LTR15_007057 [Elasticomyces elasticus]|nr:hypothetical protein LTR15_007057 [Elasticomyces elasticus]